jgi:hypothetical protein
MCFLGERGSPGAPAIVLCAVTAWPGVIEQVPDGVFLMERLGREPDGTVLAAVHLGHHHGLDGAALILSALLLSRVRMVGRRLGIAASLYLALMFA